MHDPQTSGLFGSVRQLMATALEMVGEVRALKTLTGLRGKQRGDLQALAQAISALSQLAVQPKHRIQEAEINPMLIMPEGQGVLAVDALVLQRDASARDCQSIL